MKRGKRITALIACAALLCTTALLPANLQTAYADDTEEDSTLTYEYEDHTFTYTVDDDGEAVTITGCADEDAAATVTSLTLPEEIDGVPVEEIASQAFYEYTALAEITLPEGLTTLGSSAFYGCTSLTYIDLPDGIKSIPRSCFRNCTGLVDIDLPESLTTILDYAFAYCTSLKNLYLTDNLNIIYTYAFSYCTALEYIRFPARTISMRDGNFLQSDSVDTVEFAEGCTSVNTFVSTDSFVSDTSGIDFFANVRKLVLPSTLTSLNGISSFASLEEIEFPEGNENFAIYENGVYSADYTTLELMYPTVDTMTLHADCTAIAGSAFTGCDGLIDVEIPEGVMSIGSGAFSSCENLETVVFPESVTSIGSSALSYCTNLTDVSFYMDGALYHFTGTNTDSIKEITQLEISDASDSAVTVTDEALRVILYSEDEEWMQGTEYGYVDSCLETVIFSAGTESIEDGFFDDMTVLTSIEVAEDNAYYFSENGVLYSYAEATDTGVTAADSESASGCTLVRWPIALGAVDLADDLLAIGDSAFVGCTVVKYFEFPDSLLEVGEKAFYECEDLEIVFGTGLTTVGDEAFRRCYNSVVYLPEGVSSIGENSFYVGDNTLTVYCVAGSYAETYMIENSVTYGYWDGVDTDMAVSADDAAADDGDTDNTAADESDTDSAAADDGDTDTIVKNTKGAAVGTKVTVGQGVYKVTSSNTVTYVAAAKSNLTKVTIPASVKIGGKTYKVTAVKAAALKNSKKLKTVVIGKNVKTIGKNAFYGCKNLKKVTFKGKNVKSIGKKAFKGISKKAVVKVPKAKKSAYKKLLKKAGLPAAAKVK